MKKDTRVYIDDILESIMKIEEYVNPISEDEFYRNTLVQDAVFKRLEIIGEAVKNIPIEVKDVNTETMERSCRNARHSHTPIFWSKTGKNMDGN